MSSGSREILDPIDRVAPTVRPDRRAVMRQDWHHLTFLHWVVPAERLRPLVPAGLELDLFDGKAYVGLVPFTMTGVRPVGVPPVPLLSSFHETNLRTYVHVGGRDPGVWFFSLDAASRLAVIGARTWFHLPYYFARMSVTVSGRGGAAVPDSVAYASERRWPAPVPATCAVRCAPRGAPGLARLGTLEHFLAERYLLYASRRDRLYRGQVHHAPYPLQPAEISALGETTLAAAGLPHPDDPPLAHYARVVRVEVFPLQRVG
jgi:uncharacterized protein YqjF (DUF2071 family)